MLPTSGYFRGVACPAHEKGQCKRPFCHFRHNPKKENSCDMHVQASLAMDVNSDDTSSQIKNKPSSSSVEDLPSCSNTEASSIVNPNVNVQSELLQQLVSEAVKKVLIENPHLTSAGVDPLSLIQQTTAEVSPANSKSRKKYYLRPPDTPSYNPTPIRELNKRKLSGECNEDSASNPKAAKYVPTSLVLKNLISDASESRESGESEATDFSSAEEEDLDKQNCDFDILEEVLAEHSQNNKIKVKKKKVKALGKLQYNLINLDKKVDESSMISDARTLSDQDSNTCDGSKDSHKEYQESTVSYFLPPSPIFTSSSDGFGSYNSVVYSKSETNEEKRTIEVKSVEEDEVTKELEDTSNLSIAAKDLEYSKILDQKKEETTSAKSMSKGHLLLPKFIPTLGTPKLSRPCLRTWNPLSRITNVGDTCKDSVTATCNDSTNTIAADTCKDSTNTSVVGTCKDSTNTSAAGTCKDNSDPLEAMLQQMDEVQVAQKDRGDECSKTLSDTIKPVTSSPKNSKKCKVGLDRESISSTSTPSVNRGGKGKAEDEEVNNPVVDNVQKEKVCGKNKKLVGAVEKVKKKGGRNVESDFGKESSKVVSPKKKEKKTESRDLKSGKESSDEERLDKEKKPHDETSEAEDALDKEKKTDDESESERELRKKKRKRDCSSGSESHDSYHRKKRKKSHKRRKKYKKRRRRRGSRSESEESEAELDKEDKANEKEENDKSESSEADDKEENGKPKKHKKHRKKSRHRKKSKYRRKSKNKLRKKDRSRSQSASLSSSQDRSRSTSQHRSRSSSRHRSHSKHRSRSHSSHSKHRSRSHSRHRSRSHSRHRSSSNSRGRSRSNSRHRSRSTSRHRSRSTSRHRSRSPSKEREKGLKKIHRSSEHTNTGHESDNQTARHRKDSKSKSQTVSDTVTSSKKDKEKIHPLSTPMPIDPSKIKVEKDVYKNITAIVPDLSIVKTEKEDNPTLPCTSIKVEKTDNQNETTQVLNSTNTSKDCNKEKSIGRSDSHHEKTKDLRSSASSKRETSSHQKLSKETGFQHLHHKEKEQKRISVDKEKKENDCERRESHHDRRTSTESSKGRWKSNQDRRNSSETLLSSRKTGRQDSTDSKKSEKDPPSPKTSSSRSQRRRRSSGDKNRDSNVSSTSHQDSQPKGLSMFDMVAASIPPSKPRALKEISIFDNISQEGYESSSDSPSHSDLDEESLFQENELQDLSSNHPSTDQKKNSSHSSRNKHSSDKHSSSSKVDKVKSHTKFVKDKHSHKSSPNLVKLKSHGDSEKESKNEHLSSRKHKTTSHHSGSSSYKSSSSSHKSSSNSSKEPTYSKDIENSSKSSHSSISKDKNSKSVSHGSKHDNKSDSIRSNHSRKHSVSSHDKEKEHGSSTPKNRDHSKKSSVREREPSGSHSKGKETTNKASEKDYDKSSSHKKGKDCSKNKHDKEREHSHKKVVANNKLIMKQDEDDEERTSSSSSGMSDGELEAANDDDDDDYEGGNNSPFPDLSVLDEIPQDDWEQMMNSSDRVDLKHLENLREEEDFDLDDLDKDDPGVMEECLQMYNDYKPDPVDVERQSLSKKKKVEPKVESEPLPSKQRVARSTSVGNMIPTKSGVQPKHLKKTPAQVMRERYEKLKEQQAELLKQLERQKQQLEEQSRGVAAATSSSSAVSSTTSHRSKQSVVSSSNVSSTTPSRSRIAPASSSTSGKSSPHSTSGVTKRRMSHVPNVTSLLQARERIKNLPPTNKRSLISANIASASGSTPQTIAHTVAKGGKRFAHVPQLETLQRPTIAPEFGSKVPPNIRQRYLNSLIDECLKFLGEKEAFSLGLAEERVCYQRASSRMVYLNLAVNSVKRLRNQQEAGEAAQELLETDPMFKDHTFLEEQPSSSEKPSTSGISSSPSKEVKSHPVNPNHSRLSHFSVLAVGGNRGSWSIEKPKKNTVNIQNYLKGSNFYKYLKKYILTDKQLEENGFPAPDPEEKGKAIVKVVDTRKKQSPSSTERYCDRCSVLYTVDKWGFPLSLGPCVHHWGRPYKRRGYSGALESRYSCCGGDLEADGCCQATTHVSQNYDPNELRGFVRTLPKEGNDNDYGVYALDCEMCYTTAGNELTRVTVIDTAGNTVYEQLVKPENPIIDYNTRFSGIKESDMENVKTTIRDVQAAMLTRFSDKTILIGHSLESDFHALKLIHDTVVDTSVVFPHKMGPPFKRALKNLASEYLKKIIQNDVSGHDSAEDAISCMHLMQWRIKEDFKGFCQK